MRSLRLLIGVSLLLVLAPPIIAQDSAPPNEAPSTFPDYAEIEYEQSVITIPIYEPGGTEPVEILKLDAFMKLVREEPTRNGLGYSQFEFTIAGWELYGYSRYLDSDITFTLSPTVQPKSLGVSLQRETDYPAMIVYSAVYEIWFGQKQVAANRPGVAFAKDVMEIPPRNITVAFSKPFTNQTSAAALTKGKGKKKEGTLPVIIFDDGTCEDMDSITRQQYEAGVERAQSIRAGELTLRSTYKPQGRS